MTREPLIFAATCDLAGKTRGKAFPAALLDGRSRRGVGWTPTNVMITCFDTIAAGPYGALGDLVLVPDPATEVRLPHPDGGPEERFMLGDIRELDGSPWECCTRATLKAAIRRLEAAGLRIDAAFEHEFQFRAGDGPADGAYSFQGFAARRAYGERLSGALQASRIEPDTFMKEYGPDQYEITIGPRSALEAADAAVILRELARLIARQDGQAVTFTPIRDPASVGNGVHVHLSLTDLDGRPATWSPDTETGLSQAAGAFAAGILRDLPDLLALTAPADISYLRLTPHRWSAAFNNLGLRDREASLRICPYTATEPQAIARQFNMEYRAADAAAAPHLVLASLIHAGAAGIEDGLEPPEATAEDLSSLDAAALAARGYARLPQTLPEALARFQASERVRGWFSGQFAKVYAAHKRGEMAVLESMDTAARCAAYEAVY